MEEKNQPRRPRRNAEEQPKNESLVYGKNPVTELLKSGSGVDTVLIAENMAPPVAAYYTALAKEAGARVTATDISPQAIACARRNAEVLELTEQLEIVETDCAAGVEGPFDMLVSNPPYIPSAVVDGLDHEVVGYEPRLALDGGEDGLDFFNRLVEASLELLAPGGFFACELHETCLDEALRRATAAGLGSVQVHCDLAGKPRFLSAVR